MPFDYKILLAKGRKSNLAGGDWEVFNDNMTGNCNPNHYFQSPKIILKKKKKGKKKKDLFFTAFNLLFHDYNTLIDQLFGKSACKIITQN